jgi:hypothetical protein
MVSRGHSRGVELCSGYPSDAPVENDGLVDGQIGAHHRTPAHSPKSHNQFASCLEYDTHMPHTAHRTRTQNEQTKPEKVGLASVSVPKIGEKVSEHRNEE